MTQPNFEALGVRAPSSSPTDMRGLRRDLEAGNRILLRRPEPCVNIRAMPDLGPRILRFTLATEGIKRDGNSVACTPEAWKLDNYKKNPAVLHAHDYGSPLRPPGLQVGTCVNLFFERDGGRWVMVGDARFASHQLADDTYKLYLPVEQGGDGCGRAVSIGWDPLEYVPLESGGNHFPLNELLEWSTVGIGADADAVMRMQARGVSGDRITELMNVTRYMEAAHGRAYVLDWRDPLDQRSDPAKVAPTATPPTTRATVPTTAPTTSGTEPVRWNRQLSRAWDVTKDQFYQGTPDLGLAARYFDCEIREIAEWGDSIPSARMGAFLAALDENLGEWRVEGVRRVEWDNHKECPVEYPPEFESIRLNSKRSGEFLVAGTRFMRSVNDPSVRALMKVERYWSGLSVSLFCVRDQRDVTTTWYARTKQRAADMKLLRGEAFSLGGEFLERANVGWDDLFLERKAIDVLQRQVALMNEKGADLTSRGIILAGPPGTGKTLAGRVMMREAPNATFIWISARDLYYSGGFGGFKYAFELARENSPTIIFVEDVDNFFRNDTIDLLKSEMDGLAQRNAGIMTVLTTNFPERLPRALIDRPGRFHDVLEIGLPGQAERTAMLARWLPELTDAEARQRIIAATESYSGAHMREFATFVRTIREQDGSVLNAAVDAALRKIAEQREFIDRVQAGEGFRPSRALAAATASVRLWVPPGSKRVGKKMAAKRLAAFKEQVESLESARSEIDDVLAGLRAMIAELEGQQDTEDEDPAEPNEPDDDPVGDDTLTAAAPPSELARLAAELEASLRTDAPSSPAPPTDAPATPPAATTEPATRGAAFDDLIGSLRGSATDRIERSDAASLADLAQSLRSVAGTQGDGVQ